MIQKSLLFLLLLASFLGHAQKASDKPDPSPIFKLKKDVEFLASDDLEGRLAGSKGESMAANYIEQRFKEIKVDPYKGKYQWTFTIKDGQRVGSQAYFKVNDTKLSIGNEMIPMPYGKGDRIKGLALPFVDEPDNVWLISLRSVKIEGNNSPFKPLYERAKEAIKKGANAVVFFNDIDPGKDITIINHPKYEMLTVPVVMLNNKAYLNTIKPNMKKDWIDVDGKWGYEDANLTARNVLAMIDNKAAETIVLTANYDHMGVGAEIYNGANNNASGVASLLALAEMIRTGGLKQYNYLFLALSGSQFGNIGAITFLHENGRMGNNFSSLIDLNMLGRMNVATRALYINGVGTSPTWGTILQRNGKQFALKIDSAGVGYGSYSLFYKKNIPLLSFSTGYTSDFSKPDDDAIKINYSGQAEITGFIYKIITELDRMPKPLFTETFNMAERIENLKNDLGIIPDYSFMDDGIKVATCLTNKQADKAGIQAEDVIIQIAEFSILDFDDYVVAMTKLDKGREVQVVVKRGKNQFKYFVTL